MRGVRHVLRGYLTLPPEAARARAAGKGQLPRHAFGRERRPDRTGEVERHRVEPDRGGDPVAVLPQLIERSVAPAREIHLDPRDHFLEVLARDTKPFRAVGERARDGAGRLAAVHPVQFLAPSFEQRGRFADRFVVGDIINETAERVHRVERAAALELPPLFEIYLRYAGRVCGPPIIDREFKTVDFFVLFDVEALAPRARRLFFG